MLKKRFIANLRLVFFRLFYINFCTKKIVSFYINLRNNCNDDTIVFHNIFIKLMCLKIITQFNLYLKIELFGGSLPFLYLRLNSFENCNLQVMKLV